MCNTETLPKDSALIEPSKSTLGSFNDVKVQQLSSNYCDY